MDRDDEGREQVDDGGESLAQRLRRGALPVADALAVGVQLAGMLADAHARGRLHPDLRPDVLGWTAATRHIRPLAAAATSEAARLVYAAPEQTGRLDAQPDARSDLYGLGIVLYEILAGAPPLRSDDPLAQIHWHIAGLPRRLDRVDAAIPAPLADIVAKLLAKAPDARYQSAAGLQHDLARCAQAFAAHGAVTPFTLATQDRGTALVLPARLYAREREHALLRRLFEQVRAGATALLVVEGDAGVGKTALIRSLAEPVAHAGGSFVAGKFDQVARGVPFGALLQALRALVRQRLGASEAELAGWRARLDAALGANAGVLTEVIGELALIVGPQPAPLALGGVEAQNRFGHVLQRFVAALAAPAHPLVIFLDDLQWADAATLALLEPLLAGACPQLLLIGASRTEADDDGAAVRPAAPLSATFGALAGSGVVLERLALAPLAPDELLALVADTLNESPAHVAPLARLVHARTGGNPFFAGQVLRDLERDGQLRFDTAEGRWTWRLDRIAEAPLADDVLALTTRSIHRLGASAQAALTLAACIGNRFDAALLARVAGLSTESTEDALREARDAGLIVAARGGGQAFVHDRVQQAAHALLAPPRRAALHLRIGRILRERAGTAPADAELYDIVHHLNLGRALIEGVSERRALAALNLAAGRRAKAAGAHEAARATLRCGTGLIDAAAWPDAAAHVLAFGLHLEAAESATLCGDAEVALSDCDALIARADGAPERVQVLRLRSLACETLGRYADALEALRAGLRELGVVLPADAAAQQAALAQETSAIAALRGARAVAALVDLPTMHDDTLRRVMALLTDMWSSAYLAGQPTLARLISATLVRLSLAHGNVAESAYGYVTHAISVGALHGAYREADEYGRLALAVNERFDDRRRRARILQQFHAHVGIWCEPWRDGAAVARAACQAGLDSGDFVYAAYAAGSEPWAAIVATQDLARFVHDYTPSVALLERLKSPGFAAAVRLLLGWAGALMGTTAAPGSLSDATFDEAAYAARWRDHPLFVGLHAVARLQLDTLLGDAAAALASARRAAPLVARLPGTIWPLVQEFWHGLALARAVDADAAAAARAQQLDELRAAAQAFAARAPFCAENFEPPALLLGAELARLEGRPGDALDACERTIEFCAGRPLVMYEALAHERAALLRTLRGQPRLAALHREAAWRGYARWGAQAKCRAMQGAHPELAALAASAAAAARAVRDDTPQAAAASAPPAHGDELDLMSVLQAAQAIAAEVEVDALLRRLTVIALRVAGAERGALVLDGGHGPQVHAFDADAQPLPPEPLAESEALPRRIVQFVRRTGEAVVLADAVNDEQHGADPYVLRHRPRSLLCLPVQQQTRVLGVLVLEHRAVAGVFGAARLRTTAILATQAAISLENARLMERLAAENTYLRRDLIANVSHDLRTPLVSLRGYLELLATKGAALPAAQHDEYLAVALRQSNHLATLIDELFELAKLDFKGTTLQRERFAFAELAGDVAQKFRLDAQQREVSLSVDALPGLPFVDADLSLMERVLENLVGNALRHTPPGGSVRLAVTRDGDAIVVQVCDSGSGIAPDELPHIFDRHWRGRGGGAGLGLAIAKRILELHDSTIRVDSDGASGSRFSFRLALARGA